MGGYTRDVSGQELGKYVPVARKQILNKSQLDYNNGRAVFSTWSVSRYYKQGTSLELSHFCMEVCEEMTCWSRYQETFRNRLRTLDSVL
jgi:hypothetical protein